jgi:uncharacterized membrane protein (UPF0182 family)
MKKASLIFAVSIIVVVLVMLAVSIRFLVGMLWFDSLGFGAVFTTAWLTMLTVFVIAAMLSFTILLRSGLIAICLSGLGSEATNLDRA